MVMLAEFEENQKARKKLTQEDWNWWRRIMPDVPEDVLEMMVGSQMSRTLSCYLGIDARGVGTDEARAW